MEGGSYIKIETTTITSQRTSIEIRLQRKKFRGELMTHKVKKKIIIKVRYQKSLQQKKAIFVHSNEKRNINIIKIYVLKFVPESSIKKRWMGWVILKRPSSLKILIFWKFWNYLECWLIPTWINLFHLLTGILLSCQSSCLISSKVSI